MSKHTPLEKDIESKVCAFAKSLGCLAYKFTSPSRRSVPDRLFITPQGKVFFIEFKRMGQKPTQAQQVEIDRIRRQGVYVAIVDNVADGRTIIGEMVDPYGRGRVLTAGGQKLTLEDF